MSLSLNTSHALYSNLKMLIAVDSDGVIKDLVTPSRVIGKDGLCTIGSGTYGSHFETAANGTYNFYGVNFGTAFSQSNASPGAAIFVAANDMIASSGAESLFGGTASGGLYPRYTSANGKISHYSPGASQVSADSTASVAVGSHSFMVARKDDTDHKTYIDGALDMTGAAGPGYAGTFDVLSIGGQAGQGSVSGQFVYIAVFNDYLTDAQAAELHSSLTGSNAFALVSTGGSTPATGTLSWTEDNDATAITADVAGTVSASISWTEANDTAALIGTVTTATGTITTPVLKNNTGTVLANETGVTVNVYNSTTGVLIVQKAGQTSNASGIVTVTDALIVAGTTYAYEVVLASNGRRLPTAAAT